MCEICVSLQSEWFIQGLPAPLGVNPRVVHTIISMDSHPWIVHTIINIHSHPRILHTDSRHYYYCPKYAMACST